MKCCQLPVFTNFVHFKMAIQIKKKSEWYTEHPSVFVKTLELSFDCRTPYFTIVAPTLFLKIAICGSGVAVFNKNQRKLKPVHSMCGAYQDQTWDLLHAICLYSGMQNSVRVSVTSAFSLLSLVPCPIYHEIFIKIRLPNLCNVINRQATLPSPFGADKIIHQ